MAQFTSGQIDHFLYQLQKGDLKPDSTVKGEFSDLTLLQAVIVSDISQGYKKSVLMDFIDLGCSPDQYGASMTAISMAAQGSMEDDNIWLVRFLLDFHEKGHRSDLDILKSASGSLAKLMFRNVVRSGKVDTNVTQMRGSHILHHLADVEGFSQHIEDLWKWAPDTNPNPIHRKGYSPLTHAINSGFEDNAHAIAYNKNAKIIGELTDPEFVIDLELVDRYDGEFWSDFSELSDYAVKNGKEHLLPQEAQDIFLF